MSHGRVILILALLTFLAAGQPARADVLYEAGTSAFDGPYRVDKDVGVRKVTVTSMIAFHSPAMNARVRNLSKQDPEPLIRDLASRNLASE